ncbi:hypothetical protein MCOR02_008464 [Pyricularia oryzae]|uniref:Large ribosomal subunit protein uL15/eL18 domain-containing protein n=1 Tax=Pyricularia oryzae TaxID=318829 RepID=A0A4P7NGR4_PYROR|nr:hypothetical protein MCOR02_008464 [Pyricularia oryzae]KAI6312545.1 hypothetical protein MCOR34_005550 [Pyricularia oryzae]KAI6510393.1 hypothetical protein MCOR13_001151 [Pyricularia oryzae]KAI6636589.1 hypothetical protein MCOR14_005186 [Pyricularia oryzae]QBZ61139.1 hypothetical protein PoMZ_08085 [Pyricularia oryzae]
MPPRLPLAQAVRSCRASLTTATTTPIISSTPSITTLLGALSLQTRRQASILANLRDNPGAYNKRKRVGRGPSSGYGKTAGRGQKGRKARGAVNPWFQGGQTSLLGVWGRKGFVNHRAEDLAEVNLDRLQAWIDSGRIDATQQITPREMVRSGLAARGKDGIKIIARGSEKLKTPIDIVASRVSASAIDAIEALGGKVQTRYYTKQTIQRLVRGEMVHTTEPLPVGAEHVERILTERRSQTKHMYRMPDPTSRWDIEYYRDPAHRGYLSYQLAPGDSPSLFFKVPKTFAPKVDQAEGAQKKKKDLGDNKMW